MGHVPSPGRRAFVAAALALALGACTDDSGPKPPAPSPDPSEEVTVNGTERLGWDQQLDQGTRIQDFTFAAFVDDDRQALNAACQPAQGAAHTCSAPLPAMSAGRHTLRLVSIRLGARGPVESDRSAPLVVVKTAGRVGDRVEQRAGNSDGLVEVVADGLGPIADLAVAPDGRVFVAERGGRVRIVGDGGPSTEVGLTLDDAETAGSLGLFAVALHPEFARNGYVYLAYAARSGDGPVYRLVRSREVGGQLGEIAVLLEEGGAASDGWMALRFGADRKLYVAFGSPRVRAAERSFAGRILRLNDDGTTPDDSRAASPVFAETRGIVQGLAWLADGRWPFTTELPPAGVRVGAGLHLRGPETAPPALNKPGYAWPIRAVPGGIAFHPGLPGSAAGGQLLVAMLDGGVQRFVTDARARGGLRAVNGPLAHEYGPMRAIAVGPSGEIYVGSADRDGRNNETGGVIFRLQLPAEDRGVALRWRVLRRHSTERRPSGTHGDWPN